MNSFAFSNAASLVGFTPLAIALESEDAIALIPDAPISIAGANALAIHDAVLVTGASRVGPPRLLAAAWATSFGLSLLPRSGFSRVRASGLAGW